MHSHSPSDPTLGEGIEVGTVGRDRGRLDAGTIEDLLPEATELGVVIVNEALGGPASAPVALGHLIGEDKADPRLVAGFQGLRIVQQMQHVRPQWSASVPTCPLAEAVQATRLAS